MNIEQRLAESIRAFHTDALAGSVPLNVDLDVALTVLGATCAALRRRRIGYHHATPDTVQRRFLSTPGTITTAPGDHHRPPRPPHLLTRPAPSRPPDTTIPGGATAPCTSNTTDARPRSASHQNRGQNRCPKIGVRPPAPRIG